MKRLFSFALLLYCVVNFVIAQLLPAWQFSRGLSYEEGEGVAKDDSKAATYYLQAASAGYAPAQNSLGVMYAAGRGVPRSEDQAVAWYRKAAEQGHANAQTNLGVMYANGRGVARDDQQAVAWYRKAADQGDALGRKSLGSMYADGRGVPQDDQQAVTWYREWYRNAAGHRNAAAQFQSRGLYANAGGLYANGCNPGSEQRKGAASCPKAAEKRKAIAQEASIPSVLALLVFRGGWHVE